jgi:IS5 family transposase
MATRCRRCLLLVEAVTDARPSHAIVDRGYRGRKYVGDTEILVPGRPPVGQSKALNAKMRKRFRRRAAIEPVIGHLKADFRLARCYLKGFKGDQINLMLAAAAWNLRKWMRNILLFCLRLLAVQYPTLIPVPAR